MLVVVLGSVIVRLRRWLRWKVRVWHEARRGRTVASYQRWISGRGRKGLEVGGRGWLITTKGREQEGSRGWARKPYQNF